MTATEHEAGRPDSDATFEPPVAEFVDWIAGVVIALAGVGLVVGGSALSFVVDRALLAEGIDSGRITVVVFERDLSRAEMLTFTQDVVGWTGIGLLVTGAALVLFAIGYVVVRHRAHGRGSEAVTSYRAHAVLGAVATTVLGFLPFSPLFGGGVAGYLEAAGSDRTLTAGALSGLLAMAPIVVVLGFVTVGLVSGLSAVGEASLGIVAAAAMLFAVLFVAAYGAGLGALGGLLGDRLAGDEGW